MGAAARAPHTRELSVSEALLIDFDLVLLGHADLEGWDGLCKRLVRTADAVLDCFCEQVRAALNSIWANHRTAPQED